MSQLRVHYVLNSSFNLIASYTLKTLIIIIQRTIFFIILKIIEIVT